jgi:hypothetical protein
MNFLARFSKGLVATLFVVGAASCLAACGPDYTLFKIHVSSAQPRNDIDRCTMTIKSGDQKVLDEYQLLTVASSDPTTLAQGCAGGMTPANVGLFSFSTSRTSGTLTFTVNAYLASGEGGGVIETATDSRDIPCPSGYLDGSECKVELAMTRTK